jgi:hypothetical protein
LRPVVAARERRPVVRPDLVVEVSRDDEADQGIEVRVGVVEHADAHLDAMASFIILNNLDEELSRRPLPEENRAERCDESSYFALVSILF